MRRTPYLYVVLPLLSLLLLMPTESAAQGRDLHDVARYERMNSAGVWSVGVSMEPLLWALHPVGNGTKMGDFGLAGVAVEGGYCVADGVRVSAQLHYAGGSWAGLMAYAPAGNKESSSHLHLRLGAAVHRGRWDFGGGLLWGSSGVSDEAWSRRTVVGLSYEAGYMASPFLRVGAFYAPFVASGFDYGHTAGIRLTIVLPFTDAVVCR